MIIKIRCTDAVGMALMHMFHALELIGIDYKPEDFQFSSADDSSERTGGGGARTQYWANLPTLPDGTFDMAAVSATVQQNLRDLKAHTVNGIIYQDIVDKTISGDRPITERALREARMMKSGSSQRAVQELFNMGLISRGPIVNTAAEPEGK